MRAMTWLVGALVILLGLSPRTCSSSSWTAAWIATAVLWFFVGVGLGVVHLAKLVAGKIGAGVSKGSSGPRVGIPAPKEEHGH